MILFQVDIFCNELIIIPIHRSYHWVLGAIDMNQRCIHVYDSMSGNRDGNFQLFLDDLEQEHLDNEPIDLSGWELETPNDIPQQG
jgi:sentrin-specific protease 1